MSDSIVRQATNADIDSIHRLLVHYAEMGNLLPRSKQDVEQNLNNFYVIGEPDHILACGALEYFTDELAEVRSLMVDEKAKQKGYGKLIVEQLITISQQNNIKRLMALTYVPEFFHKLGFITVSKDIFPEKIWGICVNCYKFKNCDEIAVLLNL